MSKKHVYSKDTTGYGEFIYVDLLPEVRRSRQFNMNVIIALLFAVVLGFFVIYRPYRDATFELEQLNSINNDLIHELALTQEERDGYEIDLNAIAFQDDINEISKLKVNFNNLIDDVELLVEANGARIRSISYNSDRNELEVEISNTSDTKFEDLSNDLLALSWIKTCTFDNLGKPGGEIQYNAVYMIGVDYNAE